MGVACKWVNGGWVGVVCVWLAGWVFVACLWMGGWVCVWHVCGMGGCVCGWVGVYAACGMWLGMCGVQLSVCV